MGGLLQAPLRRTEGGVALSRALHPPRRDLKPALDRMRRERRHLQVEGLQARRSRALPGDDARHPRVHPPLSHARAARRLPPHPLLRPARQRQRAPTTSRAPANCSRCQYFPSMPSRQSAPIADQPQTPASLPLLRRPHDHHRDGSSAGATPRYRAKPANASDQDRHLMIVPALPSSRIALFVLSLPLARTRFGSRKQHARAPNHISIFTVRSIQPPAQCIARAHRVQQSTQTACRLPIRARPPTAQIPIAEHAARRGPANAPKSRFRPLEVFVRRPPELAASSDAAGIRKPSQEETSGRHPFAYTGK